MIITDGLASVLKLFPFQIFHFSPPTANMMANAVAFDASVLKEMFWLGRPFFEDIEGLRARQNLGPLYMEQVVPAT